MFHQTFYFPLLLLFIAAFTVCSSFQISSFQLEGIFPQHIKARRTRAVCMSSKTPETESNFLSNRRNFIQSTASFAFFSSVMVTWNSPVRAISIEEARERGERKLDEIEKAKGEIKKSSTGIKFREMKVGTGPEVQEGDVCYITFQATKINGDYMFSLGRGQELKKDIGEQYRMVMGKKQVPIAVEMGMEGMKEGGIRNILVPPNLGWNTSGGLPAPDTYSGRRKLELGIENPILFEVSLERVRSTKK